MVSWVDIGVHLSSTPGRVPGSLVWFDKVIRWPSDPGHLLGQLGFPPRTFSLDDSQVLVGG